MADKYTVKRDGQKWKIVEIATGETVKSGLDANAALTQCQTKNNRRK